MSYETQSQSHQDTWVLPPCPRIVAIGDLHGDIKRLNDILLKMNIIDDRLRWIAQPPNTIVVQVGDQIDSKCRDSTCDWESTPDVRVMFYMDHLDNIAKQHGGRVISLIGNHEVMNMLGDFTYVSNNSMKTFVHPQLRHRTFSPGGYIAKKYLSKRPIVLKIGSVIFCHGGITYGHYSYMNNLFAINNIFQKYCLKEPLVMEDAVRLNSLVFEQEGILWTRKYMHFFFMMKNNTLNDLEWNQFKFALNALNANAVVSGHNTVPYIVPIENTIFLIDTGLSRAFGNQEFQVLEIYQHGEQSIFQTHRISYG